MRTVDSSSFSNTPQSAEEPGRSAVATPDSMFAPAQLHRTLDPPSCTARARMLFVVVFPFVPHTTIDPWRSLPARPAMRAGSTSRAMRPGSVVAPRRISRMPCETASPTPRASFVLMPMRAPPLLGRTVRQATRAPRRDMRPYSP